MEKYTLTIGNVKFSLEIAATKAQQKRGLGGRQSMPTDAGMLFVLGAPARPRVWMKNMQFALDIIWLDSSQRVIHIEAFISPATYPQRFSAAKPAKYILELNAGKAAEAGLKIGQKLTFSDI